MLSGFTPAAPTLLQLTHLRSNNLIIAIHGFHTHVKSP